MVRLEKTIICLDIGNSSVHLGIYETGTLVFQDRQNTSSFVKSPHEILKKCLSLEYPIIYCSVVPAAEKILLDVLKYYDLKIINLSYKSKINLPINYPKKEQIGQDRIANSLAVFHFMELPCILIDVGTATTFDIVSEKGGYEGGIIVPGPQGFLDFLSQKTALLPDVELKKGQDDNLIGKDTREAMLIGATSGYKLMIEGLTKALRKQIQIKFSKTPSLITTGGNFTYLGLPNIQHKQTLTLMGLALAYQLLS